MDTELTINTAVVAIAALLLLASITGDRVKLGGGEVLAKTRGVRILFGIVGAGLMAWSLWFYWSSYVGQLRVDSVEARWDDLSANGCGGSASYTLHIQTSGSGQRSLSYSLTADGEKWADKVEVKGRGTHVVQRDVELTYPFDRLPRDARLSVELEHYHQATSPSTLHLTCDESSDDLKTRIQTFLDAYHEEVRASGRSAPAVTHYYYQYPLDWYYQSFTDEADFVAYIRKPMAATPASSPSPPSASQPSPSPSQPRCDFYNGRVAKVLNSGQPIEVETLVSWRNRFDGRKGQVVVTYRLNRTNEALGFRIQKVFETQSLGGSC